jgi:hypothetical protein
LSAIVISIAKAFILGTYHDLPKSIFNPIWTNIPSVSAAAI